MTYDWHELFREFVADHPELWPPTGAAVRLPPDFEVCCQVSPSHVLIYPGAPPVVMVERRQAENAAMGESWGEQTDG